MFNSLSTQQRLALTLTLLTSGQAAAVAGLSFGWQPSWALGISVGSTVLAAAALLASTGARRRFVTAFSAHAKRLSEGDLSTDIAAEGGSDTAQALASLQALQMSLRGTLGTMRSGTDSLTLAAQEIAQGNNDLSSRTEQTASNLQRAASSMTQLTGTVNQTADSARTANQLASSASEVAARGGQVVAQVVTTMEEINHSSKKIADIIGTIDGIAFQTNILALNAAVEAARAGEQGRGFAVVASEVRNLAQRSAEAAREIKSLIGASVEKVESGSRLVQDAGNTMSEIVASVQRVSDIIGEISAAAAEQSTGIQQINAAVTQLDQMTQQNAALVEESAAAAESLKDQSRQLSTTVSAFRLSGPNSTEHKPTAAVALSISQPAPASIAHSAIQQARSQAAATKAVTKTTIAKPLAPVAAAAVATVATAATTSATATTAATTAASTTASGSSASTSHSNNDEWESF
jgi:methyl-accepting chemotaxis protein